MARNALNRFRAQECDLAGWEVKTDWTVEVSTGEKTKWWKKDPRKDPYTYVGIEVFSSVLTAHFPDDDLRGQEFEVIGQVARILTTNFRVLTNKTCGLHIHVSNHRLGFPIGLGL